MARHETLALAKELAAANDRRFPGESDDYCRARDALLAEEIELRRHIWRVGEMRRALPPGGEVTADHRFVGPDGEVGLADLFGEHDTLVVYSMMYGSRHQRGSMCTALLDAWDGEVPHLEERVALAVVARSPTTGSPPTGASGAGATSGSIRSWWATSRRIMSASGTRTCPPTPSSAATAA